MRKFVYLFISLFVCEAMAIVGGTESVSKQYNCCGDYSCFASSVSQCSQKCSCYVDEYQPGSIPACMPQLTHYYNTCYRASCQQPPANISEVSCAAGQVLCCKYDETCAKTGVNKLLCACVNEAHCTDNVLCGGKKVGWTIQRDALDGWTSYSRQCYIEKINNDCYATSATKCQKIFKAKVTNEYYCSSGYYVDKSGRNTKCSKCPSTTGENDAAPQSASKEIVVDGQSYNVNPGAFVSSCYLGAGTYTDDTGTFEVAADTKCYDN